jgi:membrane protein
VALTLFILVSFTLVLLGPTIATWLADRLGFGPVFAWSWKILQWPLVFALVTLGLGLVNYFAPDAEQDWVWVTPGAVLATVLWFVATLGFKFYVTNFGSYNESYGTVGGVIVLLLWFYLSGFAILVGAEMNAEIEHASPYGKEAGEKVPGQKKKLGAAAARAYEEARRRHPTAASRSEEPPAATGPAASRAPGSKPVVPPPARVPAPSAAPAALPARASVISRMWPVVLVVAAGLLFGGRRRRAPGA